MFTNEVKLENSYCGLTVIIDKKISPWRIMDKVTGQVYADTDYRYHLKLRSDTEKLECEELFYEEHSLKVGEKGDRKLILKGNLDFKGDVQAKVEVTHEFQIPPDQPYFEERITLKNCGQNTYEVEDIEFSFRKKLYPVWEEEPSKEGLGDFHLAAVPYRIQPEWKRGRKHDYSMKEILRGNFQNSDRRDEEIVLGQRVVDQHKLRSEGWAWTNEKFGLLILKYNNEMIEYSMVGKDNYGGEACLLFGGVGFSLYKEPRSASVLEPGQEIVFGVTRYSFFKGGWKTAYYKFREFMDGKGHGLTKDYDPPVNWNELFDIGWHHSNREKLFKYYTLDSLYYEAQKAKELGCELLYLDPGWEVCEGTTLWDEERLGKVEDLVKILKEKYGLKLGYRTIGRVYRDEFPHEWYIQRSRKKAEYRRPIQSDGNPIGFWEVCTQCEAWKQEKLKRILAITSKGIKFMMFDEFDWRGPCYNPSHGHPVPSTPEGHVRAVYWLIEELHKRYPDVLVEAHDPVWPWSMRYLPTYYRQGLAGQTYDENWGFEFMWNPLQDLLSGRALCLYYYNLAYNIPLYDHITMQGDNDNCLAFWWYASTVRHLGIGGKKGLNSEKENETRYHAYKQALKEYVKLKEFYVRGEFYGIDELTHVHTLPEKGQALLNAFNVTDKPVNRTVTFDLEEIGLEAAHTMAVEGADWEREGSKVVLRIDIPAMSPILVKIKTGICGGGK
ncbi:MAG TPA: hypothetical protein EYP53_01750 [Candidatus Latescibacteria bacterium]|nr:hypothetical protein [Candidatus Latescibacterota bacterium]